MKITNNFLLVSNYNNDISWVAQFSDNYLIYDQSTADVVYPENLDPKKVIKTPHLGHNIRDYCNFIVENYDNLPERIAFVTGNIFPRHISRERFEALANNDFFTPFEDLSRHQEHWPASFFSSDGGYMEINNSWYLEFHPTRYFHDYNDFLRFSFVDPIIPRYIRFAPAANYIVERERILRYPKSFWVNLRSFVSHCPSAIPGESHLLERAFHTIWTANFVITDSMKKELTESELSQLADNAPKRQKNWRQKLSSSLSINSRQRQLAQDIAAYRRTIKIYDVFTFFNELDLLEIRLQMLAPFVDKFVIVECSETFSGKPKPLYFQENKARFKQFEDKIIHYVIKGVPKNRADLKSRLKDSKIDSLDREIITNNLTSDNVPAGQTHWLKEFYQKESIKKALVGLENNDFCFISDLDEIWNPQAILDYRRNDIFKLRQLVYAYYFNNRSNESWAGTLGTKYKNIKDGCLNHLRTKSKTKYTYVSNGGWHFTNMGGAEAIRQKLESYGHQEFNNSEIKEAIEEKMKANKDFVGRRFHFWVDDKDLPVYLKNHRTKYLKYFR